MGMFSNMRRRFAINATIRELNSLGYRELADLGITRSDIPHVARRAYLKK